MPLPAAALLAGAALAPVAGGFLSSAIGGRRSQGLYSRDEIDRQITMRQQDINRLSQNLAAARQRFLSQLPQFQQFAMKQFMPDIEAQYAGRGLQVSGGAFGSALGKQAARFQAEQLLAAPELERQDLLSVDNLRGQTFNTMLGLAGQNIPQEQPSPLAGAIGQTAGGLSSALLNAFMLNQAMQPQKPKARSVVGNEGMSPYGPYRTGYQFPG